MTVDREALEAAARDILRAIGDDPNRPGLSDTPRRFADWWREFTDYDPGRVGTAFDSEGANDMIVVQGMEVWSLCEHHLLPFRAVVSIGYIAADHILGLSKLARIAHQHAHRLQVQERLVADIADDVEKLAGTPDVAVLAHGEHLCMSMRGIKTAAVMRTSVTRGAFLDQPATRAEWLTLTGR